MLPLSSEAPGGPDMLLTASADGTIAGKRLIAGQGRAGQGNMQCNRQCNRQCYDRDSACAAVLKWQALKPALLLVMSTRACWSPRPPPMTAVWDPSRSAVRGADREMSAKHAFKAHDNGVAVSARHAVLYCTAAAISGCALLAGQ